MPGRKSGGNCDLAHAEEGELSEVARNAADLSMLTYLLKSEASRCVPGEHLTQPDIAIKRF